MHLNYLSCINKHFVPVNGKNANYILYNLHQVHVVISLDMRLISKFDFYDQQILSQRHPLIILQRGQPFCVIKAKINLDEMESFN
jgi:hypothetical protein